MIISFCLCTYAIVELLRTLDEADWLEIEDTLWKQEMRDKFPWPRFRL